MTDTPTRNITEPVRLTEYSRGAGCGCKISPQVLKEILQTKTSFPDEQLLVGNSSSDDAAVYEMDNGMALIATTDFFMPIVDDAFSFGKIAAANAISDVYAMGGSPALAIAILGWPIDKLPAALAAEVLEGARAMCREAGIPLAGGHSIDSAEPIFGLAVNGFVARQNLKQNNTAQEGDAIFLTKPLGLGILSTAQKRKVISDEDVQLMLNELCKLNRVGEALGKIAGITAMTDVTGFGLTGHLLEIAEGSGLSCHIKYSQVPVYENAKTYLAQHIFPDATYRNWNSYQNKIKFDEGVNVTEAFTVLPDPQTNGGLLFTVRPESIPEVEQLLNKSGLGNFVQPIGRMTPREDILMTVEK